MCFPSESFTQRFQVSVLYGLTTLSFEELSLRAFHVVHLLPLVESCRDSFQDGFENLPELELARPLIDISYPDRYWHIRRMFPHLQDWYDHYDPEAVAERERWTELNRGEL